MTAAGLSDGSFLQYFIAGQATARKIYYFKPNKTVDFWVQEFFIIVFRNFKMLIDSTSKKAPKTRRFGCSCLGAGRGGSGDPGGLRGCSKET